ncbi:MAG: HDOD domain-containing protein [Desulfobacteraceae bacterium]|jgi:EAL and modified HD-GYP domain-containing signal transduction protein
MDVYVARQPIFNHRKKLLAYELLFRDGTANYVPSIDGDVATSTVLSNTFFSIGMDTLLGGKLSFINFTQNLLTRKIPLLLPKQTTVVEILEDIKPTADLIEACREMARKGYAIALDDFVYTPELDPLIEMANIIKFDFRISTLDEIDAYLKRLPQKRRPILLAEKVETYEEYQAAKEMGFSLFQGYFFCKPEIVQGKEVPGEQLNLMQIIVEVNNPHFKFENVEQLIAPDVNLSYRLMRYINSAFFAKSQRIASIKQALVYMGQKEIRRFISLIGISNLAKGKPGELVRAACIRAKFCEQLAELSETKVLEAELFTLGMFSLIDAILDQSMEKVMAKLPLSNNIKSALVDGNGELIDYLSLVECYEKGQWDRVSAVCRSLQIDERKLPDLYLAACKWSNTFHQSNLH